jgi:hypothetical protein
MELSLLQETSRTTKPRGRRTTAGECATAGRPPAALQDTCREARRRRQDPAPRGAPGRRCGRAADWYWCMLQEYVLDVPEVMKECRKCFVLIV